MIFYVEEDSVITMMNQKEGKIISAKLKERKVERIKYFENLSNNLLPTFGLPLEEQRLRGFNWRGEERPISRFEVTDRDIKHSRRHELLSEVFPDYPFAKVYFTSARDSILNYKAHSDSLRAAKELARIEAQQREREAEKRDSLLRSAHLADSLENANLLADTTATALSDLADSTASADTLDVERNKKISDEIIGLEEQIAAKKSLMDSKQQALVPKEQISKLEKEERRRVKKEQSLLRKELKCYKRELKRLEKKLGRLKKKKGSR